MTRTNLIRAQYVSVLRMANPATQSCNAGTDSISAWRQPSRCQQGRSAKRLCIRRTANLEHIRFPARVCELGPIDIQDSHWESVLIHCASDQLIRSAKHGETIRAQ